MIIFPYSFSAMTAITTDMFDANFAAINSAANAANGPVFLDGSNKLPAVDGSQLTNVTSVGFLAAVNFTSSGSVNGQSNVSSVVHTSVGRYDITFSSPLAVTPTVIVASGGNFANPANLQPDFISTTGFRLYCYNGVTLIDPYAGSISAVVMM